MRLRTIGGKWRAGFLCLLLAMSWHTIVPVQTAARAFQPDAEVEEFAQIRPRRDHARRIHALTRACVAPVRLTTALREGALPRATAVQWQSIVRLRRTGIDPASDPPTAGEDH
jgi:hypothetical protein